MIVYKIFGQGYPKKMFFFNRQTYYEFRHLVRTIRRLNSNHPELHFYSHYLCLKTEKVEVTRRNYRNGKFISVGIVKPLHHVP